jgi:hypothetical protein
MRIPPVAQAARKPYPVEPGAITLVQVGVSSRADAGWHDGHAERGAVLPRGDLERSVLLQAPSPPRPLAHREDVAALDEHEHIPLGPDLVTERLVQVRQRVGREVREHRVSHHRDRQELLGCRHDNRLQ